MHVEAISFLCNNLTNKIKKLGLFDIRAFDSYDILEEEHVIALANRCPQLEELDLQSRNYISEVALSTIIEKMPNLVKLRLSDTGQIPFPKLLELGSMPNLKHLYIGYAKSPLNEALVKNLPNLKIHEGSFDIANPDPRLLIFHPNLPKILKVTLP